MQPRRRRGTGSSCTAGRSRPPGVAAGDSGLCWRQSARRLPAGFIIQPSSEVSISWPTPVRSLATRAARMPMAMPIAPSRSLRPTLGVDRFRALMGRAQHHPAAGQAHHLVPRAIFERSAGAVARAVAVDQRGDDGGQRRVVHLLLVQRRLAQVGQEHVAARHELMEESLLLGQVER